MNKFEVCGPIASSAVHNDQKNFNLAVTAYSSYGQARLLSFIIAYTFKTPGTGAEIGHRSFAMNTPFFTSMRFFRGLSFCFLFSFFLLSFAGGSDIAAHPSPLHSRTWGLSFYSGVAPTSLTRRTRNIRLGIDPSFTSTGVLSIGDDNFFDEQFGLPVVYDFLTGYVINPNLEAGIELEGVHVSGQVYTPPK